MFTYPCYFSVSFDLYLVNLRIYLVLVDWRHGDWTDQTLNVISIYAKTAFQMARFASKTKVILLINRGWAQSTMATKTISILGGKKLRY
jgi:hypothetical protein